MGLIPRVVLRPAEETKRMKIHDLITTTGALQELCDRLAKSEFVAVDTEFMRENTYWPELCLVQIATEHEAADIDPLAEATDLDPLLDLPPARKDVVYGKGW